MNHSFKPLQFQPKGKQMMVAYEVGQLNTVKKFQEIFNNINQNKAGLKKVKIMNASEDRKKNNIINVLKGRRITKENESEHQIKKQTQSVEKQDKNPLDEYYTVRILKTYLYFKYTIYIAIHVYCLNIGISELLRGF